MGDLYIGTSGWTYDDWRGRFYPSRLKEPDCLAHYAGRFRSAEINDTFQRQPRPEVLEHWASSVPSDFIFTVQVSKSITHVRRLEGVAGPWRDFFECSHALGPKLGPLLLQFPPLFQRDTELVKRFLQIAPGAVEHGLALEFRHLSWFDPLALDELRRMGVAVVIANSERYPQAPRVPTARFLYLRFHGPGQMFASSYSTDDLKPWARKIKGWLERDLTVYAYFSNDFEGHAIANAHTLRKLVEEPAGKSAAAHA